MINPPLLQLGTEEKISQCELRLHSSSSLTTPTPCTTMECYVAVCVLSTASFRRQEVVSGALAQVERSWEWQGCRRPVSSQRTALYQTCSNNAQVVSAPLCRRRTMGTKSYIKTKPPFFVHNKYLKA